MNAKWSHSGYLQVRCVKVIWLRGALEGVSQQAVIASPELSMAAACPKGENMSVSRLCPMLLLSMVLWAAHSFAQEKKIKRSDLPAAVEKTVVAQSQGAALRGFSEEKENGQTYYEAEMTVNGHGRDVLMDKTGAIVAVEEQVAMDSLLSPVKQGLQALARKGRILKVESITKHDHLVAYEAQVMTDGKRSEIQVGPDGKPLDREE